MNKDEENQSSEEDIDKSHTSDVEDYDFEDDGEYQFEDDDDGIDLDARTDRSSIGQEEKRDSNMSSTHQVSSEIANLSNRSSRQSFVECYGRFLIPEDTYVIKDYAEVGKLMDSFVSEVSNLLDRNEDIALSLLQHYRWDKERLTNDFLEDPGRVRDKTGVNLDDEINSVENLSSLFKCKICYDEDLPMQESYGLSCNHRFCVRCFREYLVNQVKDGSPCVLARCPEHKCANAVTRKDYRLLLAEEEFRRYELCVIQNFIEASKNMKYCPAPKCERVVVGSGISTVRCTCSNVFCFHCSEEAHEPCNCTQLIEWNQKCISESETANWILANTRKCPNCSTRIEKNQGCNHMSCRICKHEFCWICMGPWSEHNQSTGGFYKCNRYDPSNPNVSVTSAERAKAELDRYLHYYQRYHGHNQALKFASNQREQAERRMVERQELSHASWNDVQFLKQAVEQVIDCRRVLKYTYVLGYFLRDESPEKRLFEHHQEMLEKNTELLQEYTEKNVDAVDRTQVVNLTRATERFMNSLLSSMAGGVVTMDSTFNMISSSV